jgi:hypothetical protein
LLKNKISGKHPFFYAEVNFAKLKNPDNNTIIFYNNAFSTKKLDSAIALKHYYEEHHGLVALVIARDYQYNDQNTGKTHVVKRYLFFFSVEEYK